MSHGKEQYRITVLDAVDLLLNMDTFPGKDGIHAYADLDYFRKKLAKQYAYLTRDDLAAYLYYSNMNDEMKKFVSLDNISFDTLLKRVLKEDDTFDKNYNLIRRELIK